MPFLSSVMKPSTAPLSQLRRALSRYDTRRNTPSDGGSRLRASPVHGCDSGNWAQTGTRWPGTRAVVHEQLSWFIQVCRSATRVPVRCAAGSPAYCLNKSRPLTGARGRERFQRGWRWRRGGEGCGAARDAAHGAARARRYVLRGGSAVCWGVRPRVCPTTSSLAIRRAYRR